jgi:hypothetical protein
MCPACVASAAVVVGGVASTGGITALAVKLFRNRNLTRSEAANVSSNSIPQPVGKENTEER